MESAKDFGFNEGYTLSKGAEIPPDHTIVGTVNDERNLIFPNQLLNEEQINFKNAIGTDVDPVTFGRKYAIARSVIKQTGLTKIPDSQSTPVGVDFRGDRIYSNPLLANSKNSTEGSRLIRHGGIALGAMGVFKDFKEAQNFMSMENKIQDPAFYLELDTLRSQGDVKGFINTLGKVHNGINKDTEFTRYKLFENWNNLSPAQKAIGIAGVGVQGYKFDDGQTFETKKLTPELNGIPSLNAAEGLDLASRGVNVAPATKNWAQLATIQETFYPPKKSADIVNTANTLGLLGYGTDGRAVPIDENVMSQYDMIASPIYGVGAVTIPRGQGVPMGYEKVTDLADRTVVVPTVNRSTSVLNAPDVSTESALQIYKNWKREGRKIPVVDKGIAGGSALVGGLSNMEDNNPYTLGVAMTHATYENTNIDKNINDSSYIASTAGITLQRLLNGGGSKNIDAKGIAVINENLTEENFSKMMKNSRGAYAQAGISSKEIGYQLANQAFAEGRFSEFQLVAAQKTLDMVFNDNGYTLAQKVMTGKNKGIEITNRRYA